MIFLAILLIALGTIIGGFLGVIIGFAGFFMLMSQINKSMSRISIAQNSLAKAVGLSDSDNVCPPHKWVDDVNGFLICNVCNKSPGDILNNFSSKE